MLQPIDLIQELATHPQVSQTPPREHLHFANRLPRGRSYVRHGAVLDLKVAPGKIEAIVSGTRIYNVTVTVRPVERERWRAIVARAAGRIGSVVDLLRGRLPEDVLALVVDPASGLFPAPRQISFDCSCPDWAGMCKHVAATLYGVGARLDREPDLFFRLRNLDQAELVAEAAAGLGAAPAPAHSPNVLSGGDLSEIFGIEIAAPAPSQAAPPKAARAARPSPPSPPRAAKKKQRRRARKGTGATASGESSLDRMLRALAAALNPKKLSSAKRAGKRRR
jgi:uncharacterized Zn finger protein